MSSDDLLARAAHLYYVLGLTQKQVADRLGTTRIKAHRLLALARERGVVRIHIDAPSSSRLKLESALAEKYDLALISVAPSDTSDDVSLSQVLGQYAAPVVSPLIHSDMTLAVSWGITLKAMANVIEPASHNRLNVVPLIGSLSRRSSIDLYEAATMLAQRLGGECYYLPSPIFCDSPEACRTIRSQPMIRDILNMGRTAALSLLSVGGHSFSTLSEVGNLREEDFRSVHEAGAIGNFMGHFVDKNGELVDHEVNQRVVGLAPADSLDIPSRIMIAGGPRKVDILRVILEKRWITGFVTDETTAASLI